jgi:TPR repeat protein
MPTGAHAAGDYAPENLERTVHGMRWQCMISALCPINDKTRAVIQQVLANNASAQYLFGLTLLVGDDLPHDRPAGIAWIAKSAELGYPPAARDITSRLRNGEAIDVNETKIANALKPQADAGDAEAMRALGPMYIGGRGVKQDPALGLDMMRRATEKGSTGAETDLANLYLNGAPGVPKDRPEALKWLTSSARHANIEAMVNLGYMSVNASGSEKDLAAGYCWLVRAGLLDQVQAQEKLSMLLAQGDKDDRGTVIAPDLVQADLWFRLTARNPFHDNSQIRAMIEPHMTTDQLNEAKRQFEAWHARTLAELKTMTLTLATPAQGNCPPMT